MKVGVIGAGYWGKKHVDEYTKLGHQVLVSDLSDKNRDFCTLNYGTKSVLDYNEILRDKDIKFLSICTPNNTHHKFAMEAIKAGKNILIEKPLATNANDAKEIIEYAKKQKVILLVGHIFRFNNAINNIRKLVNSKQLGSIYTVNLFWDNLEPIFSDRDILFDLGVHPLDILDNIFNESPEGIRCFGGGFRQRNAEFAIINYHMKNILNNNDILVSIELSWLNPVRSRRLVIVGSEKTAIVECTLQKITLLENQSGVSTELDIIPNNTIRDELNAFLEFEQSVNKDVILPTGNIGLRIVKNIEFAQLSMKSRE